MHPGVKAVAGAQDDVVAVKDVQVLQQAAPLADQTQC